MSSISNDFKLHIGPRCAVIDVASDRSNFGRRGKTVMFARHHKDGHGQFGKIKSF
jgi:hypothetical protein